MRIAVLFPQDSPMVGWSMGRGIVKTLERMGIEVLAIPMPTAQGGERKQLEMMMEHLKKTLPTIEELKRCDGIIVSGPEHIGPWVEVVYERYEWKLLDVPTAAWLHESCERDDYTIDFESIQWMAKDWYFPAIQDAEKHDQPMFVEGHSHYLPFGVDTETFCPALRGFESEPDIDVAFIGLVYEKRARFLNALKQQPIPPIGIKKVHIEDVYGYQHEESARRYAEGIRRIKVFLNLPALSRLVVSKVTEVMACGTMLMTPALPGEGGVSRNMVGFETFRDLIWYRSANLPALAKMLREYSSDEFRLKRLAIAEAGARLVHDNHRLDQRLSEILAKMGLEVRVN